MLSTIASMIHSGSLLLMAPLVLLMAPLVWASPTNSGDEISDWTQWRGSSRDGISKETGWSSKGAEIPLWRVEVGMGYSGVAIQGDKLYTIGFEGRGESEGEGNAKGMDTVYCFSATTGESIWSHSYAAELRPNMHEGGSLTTPVIEDEFVFVLSREGPLYCFDSESGDVNWERNIADEFEIEIGYFGLCSSPLILEDALILNVGKTIALEKDSGETLYETKDYGYSYSTPTDFDFKGTPTLAVFNAAGLCLMDRDSGEELFLHPWTSKFNVNCATPITLGSKIFISTGYDDVGAAMFEFGGDEPRILWQNKKMRNDMTGCILHEDHLYGFDHKVLKCMDLDGEELWAERGLGQGTFIISDQRLIIISGDGELVIADASPEKFNEQSRTKVFDEGFFWTMPVISKGLIYLRNSKGFLVCRDHRKGPRGE